MILPENVADIFVEVADTLVDEFDLIDFLHNLTDHVAAICGGNTTVGLMLVDHHESLHYMASSADSARHLELHQLQYSEGPCMDCFSTHEPVIVNDLSQVVGKWPRFVPAAAASGVGSVHAFPMRLRKRVIGTINVFGEGTGLIDTADARVIQAMADIATIAILQERSIASAELLTEQLQGALSSRIVIEQAKGALSRQHGVSVDEAFKQLRTHARSNQLHLIDVAQGVLDGSVQIPTGDEPGGPARA